MTPTTPLTVPPSVVEYWWRAPSVLKAYFFTQLVSSMATTPSRVDLVVRFDSRAETRALFERVTIGADSWIGNRSVVMADVGRRCVVGAGSVVTKALPDGSLAVGAPARPVGSRDAPTAEPSRPGRPG